METNVRLLAHAQTEVLIKRRRLGVFSFGSKKIICTILTENAIIVLFSVNQITLLCKTVLFAKDGAQYA